MITNQDITIFNLRIDRATRREVYVTTNIFGVSFVKRKEADGTAIKQEDTKYSIRIPNNAKIQADRRYVDEETYRKLNDEEAKQCWTIQNGGYIVVGTVYPTSNWLWDSFKFKSGVITKTELKNYIELEGHTREIISIANYSDNTKRGSEAVKHWRIGGA